MHGWEGQAHRHVAPRLASPGARKRASPTQLRFAKENSVESLEVTGRTVKEAIETALARLGKTRDDVEVSILSEGSRGILGIGGEMARVIVSPKEMFEGQASEGDAAEVATEIVQDLLGAMGIEAEVAVRHRDVSAKDQNQVTIDIQGDDLGLLIGRRGETLAALQFITNLIMGRRLQHWPRVIVDVEGYRDRREEALSNLARRVGDKVRLTRRAMSLEAMPAYERRIVHIALQDSPYVTTESVGEGDDRRVVISLKTGAPSR